MNRGDIRKPEHKLNEMRRSDGRDKKMIQMFFNSVFLSMDDENDKEQQMILKINLFYIILIFLTNIYYL